MRRLTQIKIRDLYLFKIFVEEKEHVWVMAFVPGFNNMREERREQDWNNKMFIQTRYVLEYQFENNIDYVHHP